MSIRQEIKDLKQLGVLPPEAGVDLGLIKKIDALYRSIARPITDDEAIALVGILGADGCFGLASSFMHLIETAPSWPIKECLPVDSANPWVMELRSRAIRGGYSL